MSKKVFISHLDTPLGYHLADSFRNDHLDINCHNLIIGTSAKNEFQFIFKSINFAIHPQLACRAILDCDIVILDLRSSSNEAETIIKFLQNNSQNIQNALKIIGISSVMTWEGLKAFEQVKDGSDRQKMISHILDQDSWKHKEWTDSNFKRRIPNNFYIKSYELENMVIGLNKFNNIQASVLATGIIYGRQNSQIQRDILNGFNFQPLTVYGSGQNLVPLVHIDTLLQSIQLIQAQKDKKKNSAYLIACDTQKCCQKQIKQIILRITGNNSSITYKEQLFATKLECDWSSNVTFNSSSLFEEISVKRNFLTYANSFLLTDFCDYNEYAPIQAIAFIENFEQDSVQQLVKDLQEKYPLILHEQIQKINQQLVTKHTPVELDIPKKPTRNTSKPPSSQQERQNVNYYKQALQILFNNKRYLNYVLICKKHILTQLDQKYCYKSIVQVVPVLQQSVLKEQQLQIAFRSKEYYQFFNLQPSTLHIEQVKDNSNVDAPKKEIYEFEKQPKKDEQLILLNQYLLDNVLCPISEAKFSIKLKKKEPNLRNLIEQLKEVWTRSNWKPCLQDCSNTPIKTVK